ncbi:MAG TPA: hypothetical protein VGF69_23415 [Thermoanaerobaculia bacterium]|jgi:hypothetical protein
MNDSLPVRMLRAHQYLRVAGAFPLWPPLALLAIAAYGWFVMHNGGEARDALFMASMIVPFAAGTGLLSLGKAGRLDLLFGTGIGRLDIWSAAALRSVLLPITVVAAAVPLFIEGATPRTPLLAFVSLFIPAAVCFAAGIVQPRYALAVIWFAVRVIFVMSSAGRSIFLRIVQPGPGARTSTIEALMAVFAVPELVMLYRLPAVAVIAAVTLALVVLATSAFLIERADFGGHRSA